MPDSYATPSRTVYQQLSDNQKPPLFIILDGILLLSINNLAKMDYLLRVPSRKEQHCTAEVAAAALELAGDLDASQSLLSQISGWKIQ
ncbi:hypothetical protein [Xenorhabdus koppenhoeferi]|uniref:hypothetical protein n=1 Tax=Xenorhabdus koppenhoeferi TaxID=351659 RepID=UPI0015A5AFFD|nr:hypothetical protein [Xenorhabdus koppenhoeferi]